ncbi:uncharacterized protein ATC70_013398 [Mucor velutinosus]|uniref:Tc1-like transposase DDE domain-containing protein n=1 Tax=Mucor velutinosus TaxID=708070 RepID=A0AAN7DAK6_9FUNG|nr:hypothetical protein ATC70_013398 [Mucor velutinosus]
MVTRVVEMKNAKYKDTSTRAHNVYTDQYKARFFNFIYNDDMTAGKATKAANILRSTAYRWYKDDQDKINRRSDNGEDTPGSTETKKVGRSKLLNDDHNAHLKKEFVDSPSATIDQAMENLIGAFPGLKISKSLAHQYMVNDCALSFKKAHLHSKQRNSPESIQNRYEWVKKWEQTDVDYMSNYVFLDASAFLINLKRTMAWSERRTRAEVAVPVLRAKTTTILGAVSVWGITNVQVRIPGASVKKRKIGGGSGKTLDALDKDDRFKGFYIIMDNAPIHTANDIERYIIQQGYRCVYLPPYSPELNPIEQFWHVVKSKLKRERLLSDENLTSRIADVCNSVLYSDLEGFARYFVNKFEACLNKQPL